MRLPTQLTLAQYAWNIYGVVVGEDVSIDNVTDPKFWVNVKPNLRVRDILEVVSAAGKFELRMRVASLHEGVLRLRVLDVWDEALADKASTIVEPAGDLEIGWGGPAHKHRIVDKATKAVVKHGFETRDDAAAALDDLLRLRAA